MSSSFILVAIQNVTRGKHNEASFRRKLDPIEKNVWRKENPLELLFKDVSNFDAQNPFIGSLLREIDVGKKDTLSNFLKKAPDINDVVVKHRFDRLKKEMNRIIEIMMTMMTIIIMVALV